MGPPGVHQGGCLAPSRCHQVDPLMGPLTAMQVDPRPPDTPQSPPGDQMLAEFWRARPPGGREGLRVREASPAEELASPSLIASICSAEEVDVTAIGVDSARLRDIWTDPEEMPSLSPMVAARILPLLPFCEPAGMVAVRPPSPEPTPCAPCIE